MKAEEFGKYLKWLRKQRNLTIRQVDNMSGVSNAYLSQIERGKRGIPSASVLNKLAPVYKVSPEELMMKAGYLTQANGHNISSVRESQAKYNPTLDELRAQIAAIEKRNLNDRNNGIIPAVQVPILGVIRAGRPIYAEENIEGYAYIDQHTANLGEHFYLRVKGDSMEPTIEEGSLVLVRRQDDVMPGQIAVVIVNNEDATLKRVYADEHNCILQSDNTDYPPMIYPKEDVKILGRAVKVTKDLR